MKRIFVCLLAVLLLISVVSCGKKVNTNEELTPEDVVVIDYTYKVGSDVFDYALLTTDTVAIVGFKGDYTPHAIAIPSSIDNRSVTEISDLAFYYANNITSVEIPETVTHICKLAFAGCSKLSSVKLPNSLVSIGESAFAKTGLTSVKCGSSLNSIGDFAFSGCADLASLTISSSVETIGHYAFAECISLASVSIPASVKQIGELAFYKCAKLASVTIAGAETEIGDYAFNKCDLLEPAEISYPADSPATAFFADPYKYDKA